MRDQRAAQRPTALSPRPFSLASSRACSLLRGRLGRLSDYRLKRFGDQAVTRLLSGSTSVPSIVRVADQVLTRGPRAREADDSLRPSENR